MKKPLNYLVLLVTTIVLGFTLIVSPVWAASSADDMTKEDLYNMILELKQEIKELKAVPSSAAPSEAQVRTIIQEEVENMEPEEEDETLMDRVQIHGSLSQGWLMSSDNNWYGKTKDGTFNFNEFALNVSADITDNLRAGVQFMSRDLGAFVNNELRLDWAVLDYSWKDQLGLRIGRLKVPYGLYHESRDIDGARIALMLPQGFYGENAREIWTNVNGIGIYGSLDMQGAGILNYKMVYGDTDLSKEGESASIAESRGMIIPGTTSSITADHMFVGSLAWDTPLEGLRFNTSYQHVNLHMKGDWGHPSAGILSGNLDLNYIYGWAVGSEYTWNNLVLAGELRRSCMPTEFTAGPVAVASVSRPLGWYLSSSYRFCDWFATEISYSEYYDDSDDKDGNSSKFKGTPGNENFYAWQKIWSINARFDINDYWSFKAGVNLNNGMATGLGFQNNEAPNEEDWILYQLKTTVSF